MRNFESMLSASASADKQRRPDKASVKRMVVIRTHGEAEFAGRAFEVGWHWSKATFQLINDLRYVHVPGVAVEHFSRAVRESKFVATQHSQ